MYRPKVGEHIMHDNTREYLGQVTEVKGLVVRFNGPRYRDGLPVTMATIYEIAPHGVD